MDPNRLRTCLPEHTVGAVSLGDLTDLHELVARVNLAVLGRVDTSEAELRDDFTGDAFDAATDTLMARGPAGQVRAYGQGRDEQTGLGWIDIYIDPAFERVKFDEVADALIASCSERIVESVMSHGGSKVTLTAHLYEVERPMCEAYERNGFHVETVYWRMALTFSEVGDLAPPAPPSGCEIRRVDPDDDAVMKQGFHLYRDTFSEHHGAADADVSLEHFTSDWRGAESYDPKAWWFAYVDDEPVGMLMGDNRRLDHGEGFVRFLGVRSSSRGQGIARALLLTAFAEWRDLGRAGVQLGVDTANVTGATRLYESVGMRSLMSAVALERKVSL
jgi:mycothiol synthase